MFLLTFFRPNLPLQPEMDLDAVLYEMRMEERRDVPGYSTLKGSPDYWENWNGKEVIVKLRNGTAPHFSLPFRRGKYPDTYVLDVSSFKGDVERVKTLLDALNTREDVLFAEPVMLYRTLYWPNDPHMGSDLWGLWAIYADKAWDIERGNSAVKVCVVDEGVDYNHEDLSGNYAGGYDFVDLDSDPYPADINEMHGTHVAGTIAAVMNNSKGISGVAQVSVLSCRAMSGGSGTSEDIASCVRWCADQGARVINLSLGASSPADIIRDAIIYARDSVDKGALAVAASGNDGMSGVYYPAAYPEALAVGAIDTSGKRADFSNYGSALDVVAPGSKILSTVPYNDLYMFADGTSMATPHVSGVAALILSVNPNLSPDTVKAVILSTTVDMGELGKDYFYGYGLVNAYLALRATPRPTSVSSERTGLRVDVFGRTVKVNSRRESLIISPDGSVLARGKEITVKLPAGVYLITSGTERVKVLLR